MWSSGSDLCFLQGTWVQSLAGDEDPMPHRTAKTNFLKGFLKNGEFDYRPRRYKVTTEGTFYRQQSRGIGGRVTVTDRV